MGKTASRGETAERPKRAEERGKNPENRTRETQKLGERRVLEGVVGESGARRGAEEAVKAKDNWS